MNGHRGNLSLVVLTPKQDARARDANSGEATVGTVLADRYVQICKILCTCMILCTVTPLAQGCYIVLFGRRQVCFFIVLAKKV